ncbi:Nucleoside triphosphate pyrophosphohydrolase [Actinomadura rubteroloni]|uniref:Nucleoside triphosphate pyrophosphohydrolase n=1 Tax=Actinomadura rubteroloni TaxID=1926885 RepID=A0A2P4UQ21_9ACTN|nr:MazG family protein [Actinomadura rubteroloni]POM27142.1 Nucleoside triphosphate pyrophosphohydrolase [Actinomadura rubteroloni]
MALLLLATSHRVAPGLLTWRGWEALRSSARVLTRPGHPLLPSLADAGVTAEEVADPSAAALVASGRKETTLWIAAQDGDERLLRDVGTLVLADPLDVEVVHGSYDLPGARLLDLVAVMDTLRRECPWDREQTHESLVPYLLEESYEVADTVADGDLAALREELGDVLMQVAFHAVVASERTDETAFTIDDVAGGIVDKLVRRHPHVFADVAVSGADEVNANWEQIKKAEREAKSGAEASVLDGVPMGQPALTLAAQLQRRAARVELPEPEYGFAAPEFGARLFALVREARAAGHDPEAELREVARAFAGRVREHERD